MGKKLIAACIFFACTAFAAIVYIIVSSAECYQAKYDYRLLLAASEHGRDPCPPDWIGYKKKCYYFSDEERNWSSSQDFCSLYGASLAVIKEAEMNFVLRYKGSTSHWIGLKRDPNQPWKWIDGNDSVMKVIGDGGNCAFLNDEATASSSRCHTVHHWICSKCDEFTSPKMV